MGTFLDQLAIFHHENAICRTNRGQSVRDDKRRALPGIFIERNLHLGFAFCV